MKNKRTKRKEKRMKTKKGEKRKPTSRKQPKLQKGRKQEKTDLAARGLEGNAAVCVLRALRCASSGEPGVSKKRCFASLTINGFMLWLAAAAARSCLPTTVYVATMPPSFRMRFLASVVQSAMSRPCSQRRTTCEGRVLGVGSRRR